MNQGEKDVGLFFAGCGSMWAVAAAGHMGEAFGLSMLLSGIVLGVVALVYWTEHTKREAVKSVRGYDFESGKVVDVEPSRQDDVGTQVLALKRKHRRALGLAEETISNKEHLDVVKANLDQDLANKVVDLLGLS